MKFEYIKKWLPMIGLLPVIWLGFYLLAWMEREGCGEASIGECWLSAFGNWGADVVMLKWIKSYQVLVAGFLTFTAGAFVIVSAIYQRQTVESDRSNQRAADLKNLLVIARGMFRSIGHHLANEDYDEVLTLLNEVESHATKLTQHAPRLASWLQQLSLEIKADLKTSWRQPSGPPPNNLLDPAKVPRRRNVTRACANNDVGFVFFGNSDRLIGDRGMYNHQPAQIADLKKQLREWTSLDPKSLYLTRDMFD